MLFYLRTEIGILAYHTLCNFTSALQFLIFARNVSCLSFRLQYDPAFYPMLTTQVKHFPRPCISLFFYLILTQSHFVHSCQQKSIGLKFSKSQTRSDVRYSCHHNSSRFTFPIFAHSWRFSVLHSLQSITPRIY